MFGKASYRQFIGRHGRYRVLRSSFILVYSGCGFLLQFATPEIGFPITRGSQVTGDSDPL